MNMTMGQRIAMLRKGKSMTQEQLADAMGVSAQAVSKWENDVSCPDIALLPQLAKTLGVTVDTLLTGADEPETRVLPKEQLKPAEQRIMRIVVNSSDGDKVRVNLPLGMISAFMKAGIGMDAIQLGNASDAMKKIDLAQVFALADQGLIGKLVEVESSDGDTVEIFVE